MLGFLHLNPKLLHKAKLQLRRIKRTPALGLSPPAAGVPRPGLARLGELIRIEKARSPAFEERTYDGLMEVNKRDCAASSRPRADPCHASNRRRRDHVSPRRSKRS